MKRIVPFVAALTLLASCSSLNTSRLLQSGMIAAQALSLTDAQVQEYVHQYITQLDAQSTVLPESNAYTKRLRNLTKGIQGVNEVPLNFKVYKEDEVNAFASVRAEDEPLLREATMYVSLEPCSHYGRTPPCADLIVGKGVRRVVVGCQDDFAEVRGRGIQKLRDAGIDVTVGVLEAECRWLNRRFLTFHREHRPYIILKWAQTANGFIDDNGRAVPISSPFTQMLCHKLRAEEDAILVGRVTDEREHPQLTVRQWVGPSPRRLVVDRRHPLSLEALHAQNVQSLIVEGGRKTLESFLAQDLWDEIRVETNHALVVVGGTRAPRLPASVRVVSTHRYGNNTITVFGRVTSLSLPCQA